MKLNEISIEIIHSCPNYCIHCSSNSSLTKHCIMSFDKTRELIDDASRLGANTICFSGGEPFLHPDVCEMVKYARTKGLSTAVYTSGIYNIGDGYSSIPDELLMGLCSTNCKIIVNYEAANSDTYDIVSGTRINGFCLLHDTIRKCVRLGLHVEAHMVPMVVNYKQIPEILHQCDLLGIERVSFLRLVLQGRAVENKNVTQLSLEQTDHVKDTLKNYFIKKPGQVRIGIPFSDCTTRLNCLAGTIKLNVRYDGNVYPCEAFKDDNPSFLNEIEPDCIYNKSLYEIYMHSEYLNDVRRKLVDYQYKNTCESCINQYYRKKQNL